MMTPFDWVFRSWALPRLGGAVGAWACCLPFLVRCCSGCRQVQCCCIDPQWQRKTGYNRPRAAHVWIGCSGCRQESGGTVLERECNCASRGPPARITDKIVAQQSSAYIAETPFFQSAREVVSYRRLFIADGFGVREKHCS